MDDDMLTLVPSAGQPLLCLRSPLVKFSKTIENLLKDMAIATPIISLTDAGIDERTLRTVVEWWTHHASDKPAELQQALAKGEASEWDLRFFTERFGNDCSAEREALIHAANYLDCPVLLEYACMAEANCVLSSQMIAAVQTAAVTAEERASVAAEQEWFH